VVTLTTLIGLAGGACTTFSGVPQAIKAWRTQSTKDISLGTFILVVIGVALWLIYGALLGDLPLILTNLVSLGIAVTVLALKLRYG